MLSLHRVSDSSFNAVTNAIYLILFRFREENIYRMVSLTNSGVFTSVTRRNRYAVDPLLVTCVILRRLSSTTMWM